MSRRFISRRTMLRGLRMPTIDSAELLNLMSAPPGPVVIDVRTRRGRSIDPRHIPGARLFQLDQLKLRAPELPREREIVLYCNCPDEASSAQGARLLTELGFAHVRPLAGGLDAWIAAGHIVERYATAHQDP